MIAVGAATLWTLGAILSASALDTTGGFATNPLTGKTDITVTQEHIKRDTERESVKDPDEPAPTETAPTSRLLSVWVTCAGMGPGEESSCDAALEACEVTPEEFDVAYYLWRTRSAVPVGGQEPLRTPQFWVQVAGPECHVPGDEPAPEVQQVVVTMRDVQRLPLPRPQAHSQPGGWGIVNYPVLVYATGLEPGTPTTLRTRVGQTDVEVEVVPVSFTWDFHDEDVDVPRRDAPIWDDPFWDDLPVPHPSTAFESTFTTTVAGEPYPNHEHVHVYRTRGPATVSLTTTYTARFRVAGAPDWIDIPGTATTQQPPLPLSIREARARLTG